MYIITILFFVAWILVMAYIIALDLKKISVGNCKCGGKYYYDFHNNYIDKHVYKCNKCNKQVF